MISRSRRVELRYSPKQAKAVARKKRARKKAREEQKPLSIQAVLNQCKSMTPADQAQARKEIKAMGKHHQQAVLKALAVSTPGPEKRD